MGSRRFMLAVALGAALAAGSALLLPSRALAQA